MGLERFTGMSGKKAENLYEQACTFRDSFRKELYDFRTFLDRTKSIPESERGHAREMFSQGEMLLENLNSFLGDNEIARQEFVEDKTRGSVRNLGRGPRTKAIDEDWPKAVSFLEEMRRTRERLVKYTSE